MWLSTPTQRLDGSLQLLGGSGEPGAAYHIEVNDDLSTTNWINAGNGVFGPDGTMEWTLTNQMNAPQLFFRLMQE